MQRRPFSFPPDLNSKVRLMSSTVSLVHTTDDSARVDVTVPLRAEFASIVRLIAASLGADAGFTVDDIDDLRLALSEVFSSLVDTVTAEGRDSDPRVVGEVLRLRITPL